MSTDKEKFEALFYPGTQTLINRFGEKDPERLAKIERDISTLTATEIRKNPVQGNYDLAHMSAIHKRVFDPVYPWAGQVRDFTLSKRRPDGFVTVFAHPTELQKHNQELKDLMARTKNFTAVDQKDFPREMARAYQLVNEMHPFREGNGRVHRIYLDSLANNAGHKLDFSKIEKEAWNYAASMSGRIYSSGEYFPGRTDELEKVFKHIAAPVTHANAYNKGRAGQSAETKEVLTLKDLNPRLAEQKRNYRVR